MYVHILSKLKHKLFSRIKVTISTTQSIPETAVKTEATELAEALDKLSSSVESTAETALQPSQVKHKNTTSGVKP